MSKKYYYERKVYSIFDLLIKPEKCSKCEEYMDVYYTSENGHDTVERKCKDCKKNEISPFNN